MKPDMTYVYINTSNWIKQSTTQYKQVTNHLKE